MIGRRLRILALPAVVGLAFGSLVPARTGSASEHSSIEPGGTLKVGLGFEFGAALDPDKEAFFPEIFRCCLLRTLLSYRGLPTSQRGTELFPDLASAMPEISPDGLTWTFRLKHGIHYAPPYQDTEIVANDFIRALQREATPTVWANSTSYFHVIAGFDDYFAGTASRISGLSAPNPHTLVARLTEPAGDLGNRFALPHTAPIPPNRRDPTAPLGAADGHDGTYGPYLVASGPYMIEGSQWLDFTRPAAQQRPVYGHVPNRSLTLVRNPSWDRATDSLRPAYADRIEITFFSEHTFHSGAQLELEYREAEQSVEAGRLDLIADINPPREDLARYRADPRLAERLRQYPLNGLVFLDFRLTIPPFDDIHVRRAVNDVIERKPIRTLEYPDMFGDTIGHLVPDSLERDLLANYDPYPRDFEAAKAEMRKSPYDHDHNGICDSPVCRGVPFTNQGDRALPILIRDLRRIGIHLKVTSFTKVSKPPWDPSYRNAMWFDINIPSFQGTGAGYPNASELFASRLDGGNIGDGSAVFSLIGATPKQLQSWGHRQTSVPSIDDWIDQCLPLVGARQTECWAELDQYTMEHVVPWVPVSVPVLISFLSPRVTSYSFDQAFQLPALDRIAVRPGSR